MQTSRFAASRKEAGAGQRTQPYAEEERAVPASAHRMNMSSCAGEPDEPLSMLRARDSKRAP